MRYLLFFLLCLFFSSQLFCKVHYVKQNYSFNDTLINLKSKPNVLAFNLGWNSLSGIGIQYLRDLNANFQWDLGYGYGLSGRNYSSRLNYIIYKPEYARIRFLVGFGLRYSDGAYYDKTNPIQHNPPYSIVVPSTLASQFVIGIEMKKVIFLRYFIGWHQLLSKSSYYVDYDHPQNPDAYDSVLTIDFSPHPSTLDSDLGSGIIIELSGGFEF